MICFLFLALTSYPQAYQEAITNEKTLVVTVGANWCPGCVDIKKKILPRIFQRIKHKNYIYAEVDLDKQPELCKKLMVGTTMPQTLIFYKKNGIWEKIRFIGSKNVEHSIQNTLLDIQHTTSRGVASSN